MQQVDQSLTCFKKVIAINPNLSSPYTNLGLIYTDYLKKYHEAISYLNKAIGVGAVINGLQSGISIWYKNDSFMILAQRTAQGTT